MKKLLVFLMVICTLVAFTACDFVGNLFDDDDSSSTEENGGSNNNGSSDSGNNGGGSQAPENDATLKAWREAYDCITIAEAFDICDAAGTTKSERYYVIATVKSVDDTTYGKMMIKDETGELLVYGSYGADGELRYGELTTAVPKAGDVVLLYGNFMNYNGTREMYSGWIIDFYTPGQSGSGSGTGDNSGSGSGSGSTVTGTKEDEWKKAYETITVSKANELCDKAGGTKTPDRYYVIATVKSLEDDYYGKMIIKDATGELLVYGSYGADGELRYGELTTAVPKAGDVVLLYGNFMNYNGTREMYSGWIIDFYTPGQSGSGSGTGSGGSTGDNGGNNSGSGTGSGSTEKTYDYTDFTADEKEFITDSIGFVIPFIPNSEYYVEEYSVSEDGYSAIGINFYSYGNTEAEFEEYLKLFNKYEADYTEEDEYGDMWYYYSSGDVLIDVTYYYYDGEYITDVFAYVEGSEEGGSGDIESGSGSTPATDVDIITNEGAGLPEDSDGVFDVDFTKADKVKDVTDQGYYLDGCPTAGSPAVLVIPVEFSDSLASTKGYTTDALKNAFLKDGVNDYYSLYDYYYISSYGQLDLDITVLDFWFKPKKNSTYYYDATMDISGYEEPIGDQLVLDEALAYLEGVMDLSKFDSDNNGTIDAVILVNTLDIGEEDFYWAYRYWNMYTDANEKYYEYDGVSANDYVWASYQFLYETYDEDDNMVYDDSVMNTYTFIHEFAHILGVGDYYDTSYTGDPMGGFDIMDSMIGDHNAYTKINLGWIKSSRLVVTDASITLILEDFSKSGDTIILAVNWDEKLGAYQEYYILAYYKTEGLNGGDAGYFLNDGIVVYHVNSSLYMEEYEGEIYYDVYNNNTDPSDQYGTEDNLIEFVQSSNGTYTYVEGDTLPEVTDDAGEELKYTFTVVSLGEDEAVITFSAIA